MIDGNRIRSYLHDLFGSIRNEKLRRNILQAAPFWIASFLTGLLAVLYSKLFAGAESFAAYMLHHYKWWLFLFTPAMFALALLIINKYAPYARGSGIPQVMASLELTKPSEYYLVRKLLGLKVIIVKIVASLLVALGGGIIGREGPTIQIAGSVFRKMEQWVPASWPRISRRNMIMTGAAAGLAAAFNTPLGGIVFAVEELTRTHISYFRTAIFSAVIIAGLTSQYFLGPYLYLGYPDVSHQSTFTFAAVIVAAALAGLAGSLMSKGMLAIFRWRSTLAPHKKWLYLVFCALCIVAAAVFISGTMFSSGKTLMNTVLFTSNKRVEWYIPLLRTLGPLLSFTTGIAGGVFSPSLSAGASFGALIAGWLHAAATDSNIIILSGMVGFLTGVTRTPFTAAILVLEMTDRHNVIFHLMLAGMAASMISLLVDKHSFYDHLKVQYIAELKREEAIESNGEVTS